ncbi:hydrogen peroxide-inducible genes activator [uncultured Hoeflea sp.]|uniref:hydrogen peroxide-inducible genes activator n=1 Tax=uncultured Hoeflea sp. TaxID=538666 RepID=UPI00260AD4B1|nr:hydrogen peroxide-inducible genes activator [uncultured Hoeflea sp.]
MPYRPTHRQLQYFLAVAERGHFADAAKTCHVSQPTLSTQLKLLEQQLGAELIERGSVVRPTPVGLKLLPLARAVLATLDEIVDLATTGADNLGGLVRLGVAPTFGPYFMPRFLPRLHAGFPQLEVYIREDRPTALEAGVGNGAIDCAITPLPQGDEQFETALLCDETIYLGIPAEHPLASRSRIRLDMLAGQRLLTLGRGHRLSDQVQLLCDLSGARLGEDYEGTSLDALRQMVSIGMGLSLFPAAYAASEIGDDASIRLREIDRWPIKRTLCLAWRRGSVRQAHFQILAQQAAEAIALLDVVGIVPVRS